MNIIIVGAVAGGSTVAAQIRRTNPNASITLIGREREIGYGTCGMPYAIGGIIEDRKKLNGPDPEQFQKDRNIRTLTRHEVCNINRDEKTVAIRNLETNNVFLETYDKLILSPGGRSRMPDLKGSNDFPLFALKNLENMEDILTYIEREKPTSCTIIGGGFIGVELAENFIRRGIKVALIERNERVMKVMDYEITTLLNEEMKNNGVDLYFNDAIERIEGNKLLMKNGDMLQADFIVASIGLIPNTSLAKSASLSIGPTGGIVVNEYMQTNDPDIYAIGDVAECKDWFTGKPKRVQLAWHAHRQAFIVARHLANNPVKINGFLGTTIVKLFSLTAAMTGHSEKSLQDEGFEFETVTHKGRTNAGYYPDYGAILLRVHYDRRTRLILGAQAVGDKGVDKRIDVIATAILGKMTIDDLAGLELSYSPPFSSPKDPVNMIGYRAQS